MVPLFWTDLSRAVFGTDVPPPQIHHDGLLPGPLPVSALLAASAGLAGVALARLLNRPADQVRVDGRLCAFWALTSCDPIGWTPPEPWDPLSAIFQGADGWIRLHTNAPHHKAACLRVLGDVTTAEEVAQAIAGQSVAALEERIVAAGGAAAAMIRWADWQVHSQGCAVAGDPLVEWSERPGEASRRLRLPLTGTDHPLQGIRVLDLTRVLAGPVASRTLAGYGADVLRIDPEDWDDPGLLQDTTVGKRCCGLNLRATPDRAHFETLLQQADILIHSYRPGALVGLGYDPDALDRINPTRIDVSLSAYGWNGPWAERRGFDSLVQFSAGIADLCAGPDGKPGKLPVQALDHAAGYILAACCLEALTIARSGRNVSARTSLASVGWLLCQHAQEVQTGAPMLSARPEDYAPGIELSDWGPLKRLHPPLSTEFAKLRWDIAAGELRRHAPEWPSRITAETTTLLTTD